MLGFGEGLFLAMVVPPLLALTSIALLVLLVTGRTGRLLNVSGVLGTIGGLLGAYTLVSNPNTLVLLMEDTLFAVVMLAPLPLGIIALVQWHRG